MGRMVLTAGCLKRRVRVGAAGLGSAMALVASRGAGRLLDARHRTVPSRCSPIPGRYLYYSCDQINAQLKHWTTREQELRLLMNKAEKGAGGAVVNLIAYKADHVAATEELKLLNKTAREKNCTTARKLGQQQRHPLTSRDEPSERHVAWGTARARRP